MYRVLLAYTGGRSALAEDAVAEAFARALVYDGRIHSPLPWLYRTAFRVAATEAKNEKRSVPPALRESDEIPLGDGLQDLIAALRKISPTERAAVVLRYELDLPVKEVARRLGIAAPTARVHLHRARNRLRALLGPEEEHA